MPKKLTVNEATQQISGSESDGEWLESDDDLVGSDNEGEMDSFSWPREDPLEIAQLETMEDTAIVDGRTSEPDTEAAETVQDESHLEYTFPSSSQDDGQYTPTPVLQADEPSFMANQVFRGQPGPQVSLDSTSSPCEFFELIWGEDSFDYLAEQTNLYALQKDKRGWIDTNDREMMSFVGILLATSIHKLPSIRDYWSQHAFLGGQGYLEECHAIGFLTY